MTKQKVPMTEKECQNLFRNFKGELRRNSQPCFEIEYSIDLDKMIDILKGWKKICPTGRVEISYADIEYCRYELSFTPFRNETNEEYKLRLAREAREIQEQAEREAQYQKAQEERDRKEYARLKNKYERN